MYADDLVLVSPSTNPSSVQLKRDVKEIATSIYASGLILNPTKSSSTDFHLNRSLHDQLKISFPILVDRHNLQSASEVKYLGVLFSPDLSWSPHTQQVIARIR